MEVTRLFDILDRYKEIYPEQQKALSYKREGEWHSYTLDEYITTTDYISAGLLEIGVKPGDKIAIISSSRPEYNMIDMGIMQIGAIPVPIYPTISVEDYKYILNHAEIVYVFSEGEELLRKIESILPTVPTIKGIYTFKDRGHKYLAELTELGKNSLDKHRGDIKKLKSAVKEDDTCCIIYTSGTTGLPKGVMLSHKNILMQVKVITKIFAPWCKTAFSFLPLCHAYEKLMVYAYQYNGISIYYAENLGTITENIKEVNPNIMTCVPRVLEKMYDKIFAAGKKLPFAKRQIYYWAIKLAVTYKREMHLHAYTGLYKIADDLVFSKWRAAIGGNFDIVVSGGAALQPKLCAFFTAIGMPIYEGYGLTETAPVIAVSNKEPDGLAFGTVGKPLQGVEVKIDSESGEILCRGDNVMKGYYKDPKLTAQVIDKEGWFHTGDTGVINSKGQLSVKGRLKGIFKTSMGKYVNPFVIEELFAQSPFIDNIMVVGENQKFAAAVISPSFHFLKSWCASHKVPYESDEKIIEDVRIKARINEEVKKYNEFLGETEKIKRFCLVPEEWTVKNKLLTPTLKVKRNEAAEVYKNEIEKMFV